MLGDPPEVARRQFLIVVTSGVLAGTFVADRPLQLPQVVPGTPSESVDVRAFGARGDGTGDDSGAINAALEFAYRHSVAVVIPSGRYRTVSGIVHKSGVTVRGAGAGSTTIINMSPARNMAQAVAWHLGTYGPGNAASSVHREPGIIIEDTAEGSTSVKLSDRTAAAHLASGDLVSLEGGNVNKSVESPRTPNAVARIIRSDPATGLVFLDGRAPKLTTVEGRRPVLRRLNSGLVPSLGPDAAGGGTAHLTVRAALSGVTIISAAEGYPPINLACAETTISDVRTEGWTSLSGNPVVRCVFKNVVGLYNHGAVELAYMSHDNQFENCQWTRAGRDPSPGTSFGVWVNPSEGARDSAFTNCSVTDMSDQITGAALPALELHAGCRWSGGTVASSRSRVAVLAYSGAVVEGTTIVAHRGNGVEIGGNSTVSGCRVETLGGPPATGIHVSKWGRGARVSGNILGRAGARTPSDTIIDEGLQTTLLNNETY